MMKIKDIALIGMMVAMLETGKAALEWAPNVEIVTSFLILFTIWFGPRAFFAAVTFVLVECLRYSFGLWTVMYFYIWPLLVAITLLFRKQKSPFVFVTIAGFFGLFFGALCAIPYLALGGPKVAFAWWVGGIPWDIRHGVCNAILMFVLYEPLNRAMIKVKKLYYQA